MLNKIPASKLQWLALIMLAIYPLAILMARLEIWHFRNSFLLFVLAAMVGFAVFVLAVLKLPRGDKSESRPLLIALVAVALPLAVLASNIIKVQQYPFIHDISTDLQQVPQLQAAKEQRSEDDHDVQHEGAKLIEAQQAGYPHLAPLLLAQSSSEVFAKAKQLVLARGWQLLAESQGEAQSTLEAVDSSALFGFKDDVVIRIQQTPQGVKVDMRSMSRQGQSDLGVNAKRIQQFLADLSQA